MLSSHEIEILNGWQAIANRWRYVAEQIQRKIDFALETRTMRGMEDMAEYAFNPVGIDPQYGGGGGLPVGKHPVVICASKLAPTKDNSGGMMVLTLEAIDGPAKGSKMDERLNLHNKSPQAVEIANKQLAAYCAVTGTPGFRNTEELHGKPFLVEIAQQKNNPQYVEIVALFDINGNEPTSAGAGPQQSSGAAQWGGGGQQQQTGNGFGGGQQQPEQQPQQQAGGQQWGGGGGSAGSGQPNWGGGGGSAGSGQPNWGGGH